MLTYYHVGVMSLLNQCNPRYIQVEDSCGCAVTRASISAMKPADFEANFWKEIGMEKVVANTKMARMAGVPQKSLTDLLLSRMVPLKQQAMATDGSVIQPWVYIPQAHAVNANHWIVTAGTAHPGAGSGGIHPGAWQLTVQNETGDFASALTDIHNYFRPGQYITVFYRDGSNNSQRAQFLVLDAVDATGGGTVKATVSVAPNVNATTWAGYSAGAKAPWQPTAGLAIILANSVSDYESHCYNAPSVNPNKLKAFWWQTSRRTFCYNDEYVKALEAPLTSDFFKKFRQIPLVQQRKQQEATFEREWYNTVFFGDVIDDKQDVTTYESLPTVTDPANGSCVLEYKSNTIGIITQLNNCSRVTDFQNAELDIEVLLQNLYTLKRYRSADGAIIREIECFTDRFTKSIVTEALIKYLKNKHGESWTRNFDDGKRTMFEDFTIFEYTDFYLADVGVTFRIVQNDGFDDFLGAAPSAHASSARWMMMIDWSDIQIGMAGAKSVKRQTNTADNLYNCVINPVVNHYELFSQKYNVIIGDPNRHLVYTNFDNATCPSIPTPACA